MYLDAQNLFSNDQDITGDAASTNVIDLGGDFDIQPGEPIHVLIQVTTTFAGGTSLIVSLQSDGDEAFGSATTDLATADIAQASLVKGYQFEIVGLARHNEQYIRLYYDDTGAFTAGSIVAGLIIDNQAGETAIVTV